jgi:hypothetical protein
MQFVIDERLSEYFHNWASDGFVGGSNHPRNQKIPSFQQLLQTPQPSELII